MMAELLADNGAYFLTAYAIVIGSLGGYVFWLQQRLRSAAGKPDERA